MQAVGEPTRVVAITRANVGRVQRWRGVRSGIRSYLQAMVDGEWCQVVETRSDPECLPPRAQRLRAGEYAWAPSRRRGGVNVKCKTDNGQPDHGETRRAGSFSAPNVPDAIGAPRVRKA